MSYNTLFYSLKLCSLSKNKQKGFHEDLIKKYYFGNKRVLRLNLYTNGINQSLTKMIINVYDKNIVSKHLWKILIINGFTRQWIFVQNLDFSKCAANYPSFIEDQFAFSNLELNQLKVYDIDKIKKFKNKIKRNFKYIAIWQAQNNEIFILILILAMSCLSLILGILFSFNRVEATMFKFWRKIYFFKQSLSKKEEINLEAPKKLVFG